RVFEFYDNGRWSPSAALRVPVLTAPIQINMNEEVIGTRNSRTAVTQTFTIGSAGSRLVYTAPQPAEVNLPGRIDLSRIYPELQGDSPVNVSVIRPLRVLERGTSYEATALISTATADELREASTDYPVWVQQPNASLGIGVSARVVALAQE